MSVSENEIKQLCGSLGLSREELIETACAFRKHVEPKMAAAYTVDYMGSLMINQSHAEQDKMIIEVIKSCLNMLTE